MPALLLGMVYSPVLTDIDYDHEYILPWPLDDYEKLGSVLAHEDFFGNGYQDVVIGVPDADSGLTNVGQVIVVFGWGATPGLANTKVIWYNTGYLTDKIETYSGSGHGGRFGTSLAVGDFDKMLLPKREKETVENHH